MKSHALYFIFALTIAACGAEKSAAPGKPNVTTVNEAAWSQAPTSVTDNPFTRFEGLWGIRSDSDVIMMRVSDSILTYTVKPKSGPTYIYQIKMYYAPRAGLADGRVQIDVTGLSTNVTVFDDDAAARLNSRGDCNRRDWTRGVHDLTGTCGTARSGAHGYGMYLVQGSKMHLALPAVRADGTFVHDSDANRNTDLSGPEVFKYGN